jgi:hypothetical protein
MFEIPTFPHIEITGMPLVAFNLNPRALLLFVNNYVLKMNNDFR